MSVQLHAQPYDISAAGFLFDTFEDYAATPLQTDDVSEADQSVAEKDAA